MKTELEQFIQGYVTCALWATNDESDERGGVPMDRNYSAQDVAVDSLATASAECEKFMARFTPEQWAEYAENREVRNGDGSIMEHAGHDFFLTRCGHGTGFWDRGLPEPLCDAFCKVCGEFGEVYPYVVEIAGMKQIYLS